jgi:hypothetical protein
MTMGKNFDEMHSRVKARNECEHAVRLRIADSHILASEMPRFVALAALPLAEFGQLYPDEDTAGNV